MSQTQETPSTNHSENLDVVIIGAGLSGLGMAHMLKTKRPQDRFVVLESRDSIGGTWDLFKYPGIRSDSDMYTFAYSFRPWKHKEFIGTGPRIMQYLHEMVAEEKLEEKIRFRQRVVQANWDSTEKHWFIEVTDGSGASYTIKSRFLLTCTGYYNYDKGYVPDFQGFADYQGEVAHPQHWPRDLDYKGKSVLVIGSGATAVTVVPAMAKEAAKVTMLQRSPTYVVSVPSSDGLYSLLSKLLPAGATNRVMRVKYILMQQLIYILSRRFPNFVRKLIRSQNRKALGGSADVDVHFNPRYQPWDQRMCMVPDEDLFAAVRDGSADIVTDEVDHFTAEGVKLKSGQEIRADVVVPATGLDVQFWGGIDLTIDQHKVDATRLTNYKGMMFSQVPNLVTIFGYTNAPWTLKAELTYDYVIRLLDLMESDRHQVVFPYMRQREPQADLVELQSGYIQRAKERIPRQGIHFPWRNKDLYLKDLFAIKYSRLHDEVLHFDDTAPLEEFFKGRDSSSTSVNAAKSSSPASSKAEPAVKVGDAVGAEL